MSGIVGSKLNIRGSGLVAKLGTDGQLFTSSGAGVSQAFEAAAGGGAWNLLSTFTSDGSDATAEFTSGIDSTYKVYVFDFINIHPEHDNMAFGINFSEDGGSNYNVKKQTACWGFYHQEDGSGETGGYNRGVAENTTGYADLDGEIGYDNDQSISGRIILYNPSDTTYNHHWTSYHVTCRYHENVNVGGEGGYTNSDTKAAIDAVAFEFSSGEIQGGVIKMYGVT
jgi:hypothetical protein